RQETATGPWRLLGPRQAAPGRPRSSALSVNARAASARRAPTMQRSSRPVLRSLAIAKVNVQERSVTTFVLVGDADHQLEPATEELDRLAGKPERPEPGLLCSQPGLALGEERPDGLAILEPCAAAGKPRSHPRSNARLMARRTPRDVGRSPSGGHRSNGSR